MSKFIANQTIKEMNKAGKVMKDSNILILGMAFKEDCPDIRNTKVVDIIDELQNFGANIDVYDPWIDLSEVNTSFSNKFVSNPLDNKNTYDAIVVAVGHKQFKSYRSADYEKLSNGEKVIIDVKNIVENPTWRL